MFSDDDDDHDRSDDSCDDDYDDHVSFIKIMDVTEDDVASTNLPIS